jgi:hypothetical protein
MWQDGLRPKPEAFAGSGWSLNGRSKMGFTEEQRKQFETILNEYAKTEPLLLTVEEMGRLLNECGLAPDHQRVVMTLLKGRTSDDEGIFMFKSIIDFFEILQSGTMPEFFQFVTNAISDADGRFSLIDLKELVGNLDASLKGADIRIGEKAPEEKLRFEDFWGWYCSEHGINEHDSRGEMEPPPRPSTPGPA